MLAGVSATLASLWGRRAAVMGRRALGCTSLAVAGGSFAAAAVAVAASQPDGSARAVQELCGAARVGDEFSVKRLLDRGVDVNARYPYGWTALMVAVVNGNAPVVELLLKRGANPNLADEYNPAQPPRSISGGSPGSSRVNFMRMLQSRAMEFSSTVQPDASCEGMTALHYAALFSDERSVDLLLAHGANATLKDATGCAPAEYADTDSIKAKLAKAAAAQQRAAEEAQAKQQEEERRQRRQFPLEERVKQFIVGQEGAISTVASAVRRRENGWQDEEHPLVFLFLGSSGVGKTELAKRLAEYIHKDNRDGFVRIDMSEYQEKHEVAKLIGSPPGYVGHDQGGQLTGMLQKCPNAVVLLDEVEKAHPDILNVMLQLFDEGRLTDGQGKTVDCKDAIFVMTSNLAADLIAEHGAELRNRGQDKFVSREFKDKHVRPVLKSHFQRNEFLGRIDEICFFLPFNQAELRSLVHLELTKWAAKAKQRHDIDLSWDPAVVDVVIQDYDIYFGARSLQHSVNRHIVNRLAAAHENGQLQRQAKVHVQCSAQGDISLAVTRKAGSSGTAWWSFGGQAASNDKKQ